MPSIQAMIRSRGVSARHAVAQVRPAGGTGLHDKLEQQIVLGRKVTVEGVRGELCDGQDLAHGRVDGAALAHDLPSRGDQTIEFGLVLEPPRLERALDTASAGGLQLAIEIGCQARANSNGPLPYA